jgi:hypothetical protein
MLYLMMNKVNDKYLVKVGKTSNIDNRRRAYKSANPYAIMRSTCAGTANEEKAAHRLLATIGTKVKETNEWYEVSKEVFEEFYQEGMGKVRPRQRPINFKEEF